LSGRNLLTGLFPDKKPEDFPVDIVDKNNDELFHGETAKVHPEVGPIMDKNEEF